MPEMRKWYRPMTTVVPCSAVNDRGPICKNGFRQTGVCHGFLCHCGRPEVDPWCLRDEQPKHYIDDAGRMLFRQQKDEPK